MKDFIPDWYKAQCKRVVRSMARKGLVSLPKLPAGYEPDELRRAADKCREIGLLKDNNTKHNNEHQD